MDAEIEELDTEITILRRMAELPRSKEQLQSMMNICEITQRALDKLKEDLQKRTEATPYDRS